MSCHSMPAAAQALALWRSSNSARMPRHSSRLAQAISPEMLYGVGRAAGSDRGWTGMVYRSSERGKGLGAKADLVRRFDRWAVETLNKGPVLGPRIVHFQADKA